VAVSFSPAIVGVTLPKIIIKRHRREDTVKSDSKLKINALQPLLFPILLLTVSVVLLNAIHSQSLWHVVGYALPSWVFPIAQVMTACSIVFFWCRLVEVTFWNRLEVKRGRPVPRLLKDFLAGLFWLSAAFAVFSFVFEKNLTALLTASTVFMGVIGLALQRPIMDAFAGIMLSFQGPFGIGDWVKIDDTSNALGCVTEITWRAVHLTTVDEVTCVIPNHEFVNKQVRIYTRPDFFFRDSIQITLPYSVTAFRAERLLIGAANQVPECSEIPRSASISVVEYTNSGILWRLYYWCPDGRLERWRFKVHQAVQRSLYYASVTVPAPMLNIQSCEMWPHETEQEPVHNKLLYELPLFASLTDEEFAFLLSHVPTRLCPAGEPVLRQGDPGSSLFVVQEGALAVYIQHHPGNDKQVADLRPGQFFGERSLLMGEPRSATVIPSVDSIVVEIEHAAIAPLFKARPELMDFLSEVLAERDAANGSLFKRENDKNSTVRASVAAQMLKQIRAFFSL
jgi:small-conductance mechanosensitive channel/CRP-like cAMP-binding protein